MAQSRPCSHRRSSWSAARAAAPPTGSWSRRGWSGPVTGRFRSTCRTGPGPRSPTRPTPSSRRPARPSTSSWWPSPWAGSAPPWPATGSPVGLAGAAERDDPAARGDRRGVVGQHRASGRRPGERRSARAATPTLPFDARDGVLPRPAAGGPRAGDAVREQRTGRLAVRAYPSTGPPGRRCRPRCWRAGTTGCSRSTFQQRVARERLGLEVEASPRRPPGRPQPARRPGRNGCWPARLSRASGADRAA